jgi:hypothetical protein
VLMSNQKRDKSVKPITAPLIIAIGLSLLIAHCCWPMLPVAIAVALVAFGALMAVMERAAKVGSIRFSVAVHLVVYTELYLLLVGAMCDAAVRGPREGLTLLQVIDLGVGTLVMVGAVRLAVRQMLGGGDAPAR